MNRYSSHALSGQNAEIGLSLGGPTQGTNVRGNTVYGNGTYEVEATVPAMANVLTNGNVT